MKLWHLFPNETMYQKPYNPWKPWFDKCFGYVIRAETEQEAREIANYNAGDEKYNVGDVWLNPVFADCVELTANGETGIVIRDFRSA